jgi:hypothetical protein
VRLNPHTGHQPHTPALIASEQHGIVTHPQLEAARFRALLA